MGCGPSTESTQNFGNVDKRPLAKPKPRPIEQLRAPRGSPVKTIASPRREDTLDEDWGIRAKSQQTEPSDTKATEKYEKKVKKSFKQVLKYDRKYKHDAVRNLLVGDPDQQVKNNARVVRIFTSSTFTDTKHERNYLMEKVYPKIKTYCQELGYEFQVVDMRWGIREEAEDDHTTTEACLKEIKACQQLSTGPNFVTFLSHKYGYRPFPRVIPAEEFEIITQDATEQEKQIIKTWFKKDENSIPAVYILQPISSCYPEMKSSDPDEQAGAWNKWNRINEQLQALLLRGARSHLKNPDAVHNYQMSVTERELQNGIFEAEDPSRCLWFKRTFVDIDTAPHDGKLPRFMECGDKPKAVEARDFMRNLKEKKLPQHLSESNILSYDVHWDDLGINPEIAEHAEYLEKLCDDFETNLAGRIHRAVDKATRHENADPLYMETLQHSSFRQAKCKSFNGREVVLASIEKYLKDKNTSMPFVLAGLSGCGKTSIMAKAATETWTWFQGKACIIYRFIGTSQGSSTIRPLLNSINDQIMTVYAPSVKRKNDKMEMKPLTEEFLLYVSCIPEEKPLIIYLDSLDQLDGADGGRQLDWLPKQLPHNVKIILSTLPQQQYICFARCQAMFPENKYVCNVPALTTKDTDGILDNWLTEATRTLTEAQRTHLIHTIVHNPIPLLLKLSFDEAVRWHSYDPLDQTLLQNSVPKMISALFDRLEKIHGKILVTHSLAYLSAARVGLTAVEVEDILSLSDDVLNDVYQFWTPPLRRLPPLLWVRIKNEIEEYVVYRGADGAQVLYWYHRQFIETATERYLSDETFHKKCHLDIAHYFMGTWANKCKPYIDKKGRKKEAERYVSSQPLMFNDQYNLRKLNQLSYHLIKAEERDLLKQEVICNYEFLLAKVKSAGLRPVLSDLKAAQLAFPKDHDISVILEALQLSSEALTHSANQLAGQLVGRIHDYGASTVTMVTQAKALMASGSLDEATTAMMSKIVGVLQDLMATMDKKQKNLKALCAQARHSSVSVLIPHTGFLVPPGGQLLHKLYGHFANVNDIGMSVDGKIVATASDDKSVKLWNIYTGATLRVIDLPSEVKFIVYLPGHRLLASCTMGNIVVIDTSTGEIITKVDASAVPSEYAARPIVTIETGGEYYIVAPRSGFIDIYDVKDGKIKTTFPDDLKAHKTKIWGEQKVIAGAFHYIVYSAFADDDFYVVPMETLDSAKMFKVHVFEEEAEWMNLDTKDHISDIAIAEKEKQIIVVNGKTQELLFFDLETRQRLKVFNKNKGKTIADMRYSLKEHSIYYTADNEVGQLQMGSNNIVLNFRHPCKVSRVVSQDGRLIATIAEDNILRVWDKVMEPFKPDLSAITGQVHVTSGSRDQVSVMMEEMLGGDMSLDTSSALTTQDVKNYWTKDAKSSSNDKVFTKFHALPGNSRYVVVLQNHAEPKILRQWTRCMSIWDTASHGTVQIVRRVFFPLIQNDALGTYYVHCLVDRFYAFVQQNGFDTTFHLLNLKTWKLSAFKSSKSVKKVWKGLTLCLHRSKVVVAETQFDQLTVFDLKTQESCGYLEISDATRDWHLKQIGVSYPYRTAQMSVHKFDDIQVTDDEGRIMTVWGHWIVTVWDTEKCQQLFEFRISDHFSSLDPKRHCVTLGNVTEDQYLLVSANVEAKSSQHNSSCVLNIIAGCFVGYTFARTDNVHVLQKINVEGMGALLQECEDKPRRLQWIGVGRDGDSVVIDEQIVGVYTNSMVMSDNASRYVTWCTEPQEKTIRLWGVVEGQLHTIGAFTPDDEVCDLHLVDDENMMLINTASGLIQLQLCGRDVIPVSNSARNSAPTDYSGIDMKIVIEKPSS